MGVCWILPWMQNRFCTHVSASSCLRSLAPEFYCCCSAFAHTTACLVVRAAGGVPGPFAGPVAERRSTGDDFMLVHQQLLRSINRRRLDPLPARRADSLHTPSERRHFLPLRSVYRPVFVFVFRRGVRRLESLGARRL